MTTQNTIYNKSFPILFYSSIADARKEMKKMIGWKLEAVKVQNKFAIKCDGKKYLRQGLFVC